MLAIADAAIAWVPPERMALVAIPPELMFWIPEAKTVVPESVPNRVCRPPALMVPDIALPPVATVWVPAERIWVLLAIPDELIFC